MYLYGSGLGVACDTLNSKTTSADGLSRSICSVVTSLSVVVQWILYEENSCTNVGLTTNVGAPADNEQQTRHLDD